MSLFSHRQPSHKPEKCPCFSLNAHVYAPSVSSWRGHAHLPPPRQFIGRMSAPDDVSRSPRRGLKKQARARRSSCSRGADAAADMDSSGKRENPLGAAGLCSKLFLWWVQASCNALTGEAAAAVGKQKHERHWSTSFQSPNQRKVNKLRLYYYMEIYNYKRFIQT